MNVIYTTNNSIHMNILPAKDCVFNEQYKLVEYIEKIIDLQ